VPGGGRPRRRRLRRRLIPLLPAAPERPAERDPVARRRARGRESKRDLIWPALGADGTLAVAAAVDWEPSTIGLGRVTLRTFDANNRLIGGPFAVTGPIRDPNETSYPDGLAVAPDGRVLLVWAQFGPPYLPEVYARVFTREAVPESEPFRLHSPDNRDRYILCANATWAGGSWAVVWMGFSGSSSEAPPPTIYVRRFAGE